MVMEVPLHIDSLAFCLVTSSPGRMVHLDFTAALHMLSQQDLSAPTTPCRDLKECCLWHRNEPAIPREHKDKILAKEETMRTELRL